MPVISTGWDVKNPKANCPLMNVSNCRQAPQASILISLAIGLLASRGVRCSSVVKAFAHSVMGHRIDPSWGGLIELFFVPASASRLV